MAIINTKQDVEEIAEQLSALNGWLEEIYGKMERAEGINKSIADSLFTIAENTRK